MKCKNPIFIHYVHDMERAIEFYQKVFEVETLSVSPGWSTLDFEQFQLALHILGTDDDEHPMPHAGLNVEVDLIEDRQVVIEENGGVLVWLREPNAFVPVRVASFTDSEGNGFELRQEVS